MKLSERQEMKRNKEREMKVYKRDEMIQKARFTLSVQEQRCILYALSKVKQSDTELTKYTLDLKDFYRLCGIEDESYTRLKKTLKDLSDKSWWAVIDDKGTESLLRWFSVLRTNQRSGKVTVQFHPDMIPFILQLTEQNAFYTAYSLINVLPMKSQYSPRLYEILKSYQKNNIEWFFEIDKLKHLLDCDGDSYKNFNDFKRFVLQPAVDEINAYSDLEIAYDLEKEGRKISRITFYMANKRPERLLKARQDAVRELDGQLSLEDILKLTDAQSQKADFFRKVNGNK